MKLADYFPGIRSRQEILNHIYSHQNLTALFLSWNQKDQETCLDCCTGIRGVKVLYAGVFKEIFNPEYAPERLESLLSLLFQKR